MEIVFVQKRLMHNKKFILRDKTLFVENKHFREHSKIEIPLQNVGFDIVYHADNTTPGKVVTFGCLGVIVLLFILYFTNHCDIFILTFNSFLCAVIAVGSYIAPHKDVIALTGGRNRIEFHREYPSETEVLDFIGKVRIAVAAALKEKYTAYSSTTSQEDYYTCLNWLLNKGIINMVELEEFKYNFDAEHLPGDFWQFIPN